MDTADGLIIHTIWFWFWHPHEPVWGFAVWATKVAWRASRHAYNLALLSMTVLWRAGRHSWRWPRQATTAP